MLKRIRYITLLLATLLIISVSCIHASNFQFRLCGIDVVKTTPAKVGPVVLSVCLVHVQDSFLKNVKIYVHMYGSNTITPLPIQYSLVYPYQTIRFNVVVNTTTEKWHTVKIVIWWEKELGLSISRTGTIVPGYAISVIPKEQRINQTIYIPGEPMLRIYLKPTVLSPNSRYVLTLRLCNYGSGRIYNLNLKLSIIPTTTTVTIVNTGKLSIYRDILEPYRCAEYNFTVVTGSGMGVATLKIYGYYVDSIGNIENVIEEIPLTVSSYSLIQVFPVKLSVPTGSTNNVTIAICNTYSTDVENVTLILESIRGAVLTGSSEIHVGSISPGTCKYVNITLTTPRLSSRYQQGITMSYLLTYEVPPKMLIYRYGSINLQVLLEPELAISQLTVVPKTPIVGQSLIISLLVENYGTASAYNVNISIVPGPGLRPITPTYSVYVREEPYSQVPASFTFNVTREGTLKYTIVITYLDPYGHIHKLVKVGYVKVSKSYLPLSLSPNLATTNKTQYYMSYMVATIVGIVIVISIVLAYRRKMRL